MSAGRASAHSEFNLEATSTLPVQIWIEANGGGWAAALEQQALSSGRWVGRDVVLASGHPGDQGALPIRAGCPRPWGEYYCR